MHTFQAYPWNFQSIIYQSFFGWENRVDLYREGISIHLLLKEGEPKDVETYFKAHAAFEK